MADLPFPDSGISQETRTAMYPDTYSDKLGKVYTNLIDEIVRPAHVQSNVPDHSILLDELQSCTKQTSQLAVSKTDLTPQCYARP